MLRELYRNSDYDWITKVEELTKKAENIAPNLFLFDNFVEKEIEDLENASDQLVYTYTIINLYGLFFDSGKYIKEQDSVFMTGISREDSLCLKNFYITLQELRSIICHNKPCDSLQTQHLKLLPEWNKNEWGNFKNLKTSTSKFSYENSFKILIKSAVYALDIILKCLSNISDEKKDHFIKEWYQSIVAWYQKDQTIHYRAANSFYTCERQRVKKYIRSCFTIEHENEYFNKFREEVRGIVDNGGGSTYWDGLFDEFFSNSAINPVKLSPLNALKNIFDKKFPQ